MPRVVANTASPIALAKRDRLEILRRLYSELLVPEAVLSEVKYEPARTRVREASWIRVLPLCKNQHYGKTNLSQAYGRELDIY